MVVVGSGPKGISIAAKWTAYKYFKFKDLPELFVVDKAPDAGAHWDGHNGYTDGLRPLCTTPEHDLGFPYQDFDKRVNDFMQSVFSWHAFQIDMGVYKEWIDRGEPFPDHAEWHQYLDWAKKKCSDVNFIVDEVTKIRANDHWTLDLGSGNQIDCSHLVVTGPGEPIRVPIKSGINSDRLTTGKDFWNDVPKFEPFLSIPEYSEDKSIVVIGSGGTAATIIAGLLEMTSLPISVVSRSATLFSRGESFFEVKFLSDPWDWTQLPLSLRRGLIRRIDRGVISDQNMSFINSADTVIHHRGSADRIEIVKRHEDSEFIPVLFGNTEIYDEFKGVEKIPFQLPADLIVDAGGFDSWWFTELLVGELKQVFDNKPLRDVLEESINNYLEIPTDVPNEKLIQSGVPVSIADKFLRSHFCTKGLLLAVPMLAGLSQGPGFPNLTCLGLLSSRVLERYV
tara:strand:- start:123 stop:1478 length:1356 start_codon:yes stop_codon:yes gene_type:complete